MEVGGYGNNFKIWTIGGVSLEMGILHGVATGWRDRERPDGIGVPGG